MATACQISTANVEMKKVITPRYNSTATPAAVKHRADSPYGGAASRRISTATTGITRFWSSTATVRPP